MQADGASCLRSWRDHRIQRRRKWWNVISQTCSPEVLASLFDASPAEILSVDAATLDIRSANRAARANLVLEWPGRGGILDILPEFDLPSLRARLAPLMLSETTTVGFVSSVARRNGSLSEGVLSFSLVDGERPEFLVFLRDATEERGELMDAKRARDQLLAAVETLPDGFVLYDRSDRLVVCNQKYREFYALSASAMVPGASFEEILRYGLRAGQYSAAVGREDEWLNERLRAHQVADRPIEQQLSDGRWLRILEQRTPDGGRVGLRIDITSQVQSRERAERAEQRLTDAINALPAGFWLFDADDRLVMLNQQYLQMFSSSIDALKPGMTYEEILRYGLENGQYPQAVGNEETWLKSALDARSKGAYELEYRLDSGRWIRSSNSGTTDGGRVGHNFQFGS